MDSSSGGNLRDQQPVDTRVGIDLIGIGCRFPGTGNSMPDRECRSPDDFWRMLLDGSKAAIREIPASRGWDPTEYLDKNGGPGKVITARAGWLDEIDRFDHALFHLSRKVHNCALQS
jgi:acyl transferase domain-containing protein